MAYKEGALVIPRPFKLRLEFNAASGKKGKTYLNDEHAPFINYGIWDMTTEQKEDPNFDGLEYWQGMLFGVQGERCGEIMYRFFVKVPQNYPQEPPIIRMVSKIALPCIDPRGFIIVSRIPGFTWTPQHNIADVLMAIRDTMKDKVFIAQSWQCREQVFFTEVAGRPDKCF